MSKICTFCANETNEKKLHCETELCEFEHLECDSCMQENKCFVCGDFGVLKCFHHRNGNLECCICDFEICNLCYESNSSVFLFKCNICLDNYCDVCEPQYLKMCKDCKNNELICQACFNSHASHS